MAAWLHDIGYAADLARLGFHPVDGARHLQTLGAPEGIAELVAFHTGATYEAEERGFVAELDAFTPPSEQELNLVTMCDLAVAPTGDLIVDEKRIVEILDRYEPDHPVYSAVSRSRASLLAASSAGKRQLGLPSDWPIPSTTPTSREPRPGMSSIRASHGLRHVADRGGDIHMPPGRAVAIHR